jgi:hypothetical protein
VLDFLKMPDFEKFDGSFEQICDERAKFLLHKSEHIKHRKIVVMYSGGIDSTLMLCSFLKTSTKKQLSNIVVLLSDESVRENENFYYNYVIKNFKCVSSYRFPYFLGNDDYLFLSGENADQLFGSQANDSFALRNHYSDLFDDININGGMVLDYFISRLPDENKRYAEPIFLLLKNIVDKAQIELTNIYQFFWWINFTTKWQNVYLRSIPYSMNKTTIKLQENYTTFYHTKEFQLWSLNNFDKFSCDIGYYGKNVSKEYIFNFNQDKTYLKKPKIGSLINLAKSKELVYTIDSNMNFKNEYPNQQYFNYENDFVRMS